MLLLLVRSAIVWASDRFSVLYENYDCIFVSFCLLFFSLACDIQVHGPYNVKEVYTIWTKDCFAGIC